MSDMVHVVTIASGSHWRKWPGRTACGSKVQGGSVDTPISCELCQELLASWYADAGWLVTSDAPLEKLGLVPGTVYTYRQAADRVKQIRKQQFRWKKELGFYPKVWLLVDRRTARSRAG